MFPCVFPRDIQPRATRVENSFAPNRNILSVSSIFVTRAKTKMASVTSPVISIEKCYFLIIIIKKCYVLSVILLRSVSIRRHRTDEFERKWKRRNYRVRFGRSLWSAQPVASAMG